jgi:hypothetical protein
MNVINYIEDEMEYNIKDINEIKVNNVYYCYYNIHCFKDNYYLKYLFEECDNNYHFFGGKYISYKRMQDEGEQYCNKVKNTLNVEMVDYIGYKVFENDVFIFYEIKDEINTTIPKYTFGTVYDILNKHTIYGGSINTKIINMFKKNEHLCFLSAMNQGEKYNIPITFYKNISSSEINFTRYFGPKREGEKKYIKLNQNYKKDSNYNCRFLVFSNNISVGNENNTEICFNAEKNVAYLYISGINILYVDNIYI